MLPAVTRFLAANLLRGSDALQISLRMVDNFETNGALKSDFKNRTVAVNVTYITYKLTVGCKGYRCFMYIVDNGQNEQIYIQISMY